METTVGTLAQIDPFDGSAGGNFAFVGVLITTELYQIMIIGTQARAESFDDSGGDGGGNSALAQKGPPVAFKVLKTIHQVRHHHQLRRVVFTQNRGTDDRPTADWVLFRCADWALYLYPEAPLTPKRTESVSLAVSYGCHTLDKECTGVLLRRNCW